MPFVASFLIAAGCSRTTVAVTEENVADPKAVDATPPVDAKSHRSRPVIRLTESAAAKLREKLAGEPKSNLRVLVRRTGPTGFSYGLELDEKLGVTDFVDESHGFRVVVDSVSYVFLDGTTIDWVTQADGSAGFKFDNPNAVKK
jgi:iron-sulfur cluster assembly accessory protein